MTTFSTNTGFNSVAIQSKDETYFELARGLNSVAIGVEAGTYFALLNGLNSVSIGLDVSIGRVFLLGVPYVGSINVFVESAQGSYSYIGESSPFTIYPYTDGAGAPIEHTITVTASGYIAELTLFPDPSGFVDFNLVATVFSGLADVVLNIPVSGAVADVETDVCLCAIDCQYQELALSDASGTAYKNDSSSFLFDRISASNTIAFELWKDGAKIADLTDSTYGTYYDSFAVKPYYKGFVIDWFLVTDTLGFGLYQFRAIKTIFGSASTFESRLFRALPYSDDLADGSVVLASIQTGNIIRNPLDYTELISTGWSSNYRIKGRFGDKTPTFEADNYQSSDYSIRQIRDQVKNEYTLECRLLPATVADWLTENAVLSNSLFVTDYNILNSSIYRRLPVKVSNFEETNHYPQSRLIKYVIKFTDETPNIIKRNF